MSRLSFRLLGPVEFALDDVPVQNQLSAKEKALLVYLLLQPRRPFRRDVLAGLLWPEHDQSASRGNLRHALYNLRCALEMPEAAAPLFLSAGETLQCNSRSDYWLDVDRFTELAGPQEASFDHLEDALRLYRGDLADDLWVDDSPEFEDWLSLQRERLRRLALSACSRLTDSLAAAGDLAGACESARRQLEKEPWQEETHRQLMRLLARCGQRAAALAQYETCRRLLRQELDVTPESETTALHIQIRDGALQADTAPIYSSLPVSLVPFVGREQELADLDGLLCGSDIRLLTLVGPGGSGKTRLALEAASRAAPAYPQGVCYISLAALDSADALAPAVAQALGLTTAYSEAGAASRGSSMPSMQMICAFLRERRMLLILDNFEHLLDAAGQVSELLAAAPLVRALVTSRASLNIPGEQLYQVSGMQCGSPESPDPNSCLSEASTPSAVTLFIQSARQLRRGWAPSPADLHAVTRICRMVEGLPLAVLLAASWIEVLTPEEITERIEQDCVDFLDSGWRGVPERQRNMRAVFEHSWRLLDTHSQNVLAALAVFRGGFSVEAARAVAGAELHDLMFQVTHSLVHTHGGGRYELHELLRQYVLSRLEEDSAAANGARDRHAAFFAASLQRWNEDIRGPRQVEALAETAAEYDNIRAAWHWAIERSRLDWLAQGCDGLGLYCYYRVHDESAAQLFTAAVDMAERFDQANPAEAGVRGRTLAALLGWQAFYIWRAGSAETGYTIAQRASDLLDRLGQCGQEIRREQAVVLWLIWQLLAGWKYEEAHGVLERHLALCRRLEDSWGIAHAQAGLGEYWFHAGNYEQALALCWQALELYREMGNCYGIASSQHLIGKLLLFSGRTAEAEAPLRECAALSREIGAVLRVAYSTNMLSYVAAAGGRAEEQVLLQQEAAALFSAVGMQGAESPVTIGLVEMHLGHYQDAKAAMLLYLERVQNCRIMWEISEAYLVLSCVALAEGDYEAALAYAQLGLQSRSGLPDASFSLLFYLNLVVVYLGLGQKSEAWEALRHVLRRTGQIKEYWTKLCIAANCALLLLAEGQLERAVELNTLFTSSALAANSVWYNDVYTRPVEAAATVLPADIAAAARERGRQRTLDVTVRELALEFGAENG